MNTLLRITVLVLTGLLLPGCSRIGAGTLAPRRSPQFFYLPMLFWLVAACAFAQDPSRPLQPLDRSTPRAALKTFLDCGDTVAERIAKDYLPAPSREKFHQLLPLSEDFVASLDLGEVPPAARLKVGRAAALALYETLSRIELPPLDEIPGTNRWDQSFGTNASFWVVPNTEIVLVESRGKSHRGEFLFSTDTVARAAGFYERVRDLPYLRPVPLQHMKEITSVGGGWMIPHRWIQAMPDLLHAPILSQAAWKWIGLLLLLGLFSWLLRFAYRFSARGTSAHPFFKAVRELALPGFFLLATPVVAYFAEVQLNMGGEVGSSIELAATALMFIAGAWILWRIAPVIAEGIIASPKIAPESIDAHLIRICTRLLGIIAGLGVLVTGADRLGLPLYGIIAGLGVGGLAIALAAQPTIENLIGGLSLFADKPIKVGDFCRYGDDMGKVEAIGIRSTRIRSLDRTVTIIPNAALSRMPVVNLSQRDRIQMKTIIGVRYETTPAQLSYVLVRIREMLLADPRVSPDPLRVQFAGFGPSALEIEVSALINTCDWGDFLNIRQDLYLRIMDLVHESGTGFAFPSQTVYFTRDKGLNEKQAEVAEAQLRQWMDSGHPWSSTPVPGQVAQRADNPQIGK